MIINWSHHKQMKVCLDNMYSWESGGGKEGYWPLGFWVLFTKFTFHLTFNNDGYETSQDNFEKFKIYENIETFSRFLFVLTSSLLPHASN